MSVSQCHLYDLLPPSYEDACGASGTARTPSPSADSANGPILAVSTPRYGNLSSSENSAGELKQNPKSPSMARSASTEPVISQKKSVESGDIPGETVRAVYAYEADTDVELTIAEGDLLTVVSRSDNAGNTDWLYVEDAFGKRGYVPRGYTIVSEETKK